MSKTHTYILGINAYDHDVSACLLARRRDRVRHRQGADQRAKSTTPVFTRKWSIIACSAEGITLDDVDLVVRNCYVLPVEDMERRLIYQDMPGIHGRRRSACKRTKNPLFRSKSDKVVTVSHHLAHAYSAFAVCPFKEGVVMVVDGVGSYAADIAEAGQLTDNRQSARARVGELLPVRGLETRDAEEGLARTRSRISQRRILQHEGPRRALQPGLELHLRRLEQMRRSDGPRALRTRRPDQAAGRLRERRRSTFREWTAAFDQPYLPEGDRKWESSPAMQHWQDLAWRVQDDTERVLIERAIWLRETTGAKNLCIAGGVGAQLRRQRQDRARGRLRQCLDSARGRRRRHRHRLRLLRPPRHPEEAAQLRHGARLSRRAVQRAEAVQPRPNKWLVTRQDVQRAEATTSTAETAKVLAEGKSSAGFRAAPSSARARSAIAASSPTRARPR